ncbi:MAG: PIN/TRAM domain-containing protein, partial [Chloroflexota bacterium]
MADLLVVRLALLLTLTGAALFLRPFGWGWAASALCGLVVAGGIILFEMRLRRASLKRLIGAAVGSILGILGAFLVSFFIRGSGLDPHSSTFLSMVVLLVMGYVGLIVGAEKGDLLNLAALGGLLGGERPRRMAKLLDTSVIIDGRIAAIVAAGFLDGSLLIPQFVLRELQLVADSADAVKRARGRRGLDVLQRMQKLNFPGAIEVKIIEDDIPHLREVDLKLIELARRYECKLVTNDTNLGKMAQLQHVQVLNIHELAHTMKPVVVPGELMRVYILKEGKEPNQGVAYLDDGTMVVVDNARKMISKTIDVAVTSVLQT